MDRTMFAYSFQGSSHIRKEESPENKGKKFPCQDRSFSGNFEASEKLEKKDISLFVKGKDSSSVTVTVELKPHSTPFSLVCVSDGHGSASHFWSDKGAEFAIQTAIELLTASIDKVLKGLTSKEYRKVNGNLAKSFVRRWNRKCFEYFCSIEIDEVKNKIKELEEETDVAKKYSDELIDLERLIKEYKGIIAKEVYPSEENQKKIVGLVGEFSKLTLKEIYGCTVVVYFQVKDSPVWYAFKVGDSDLFISFGDGFVKPIKDDPICFLHNTTSLCNANAEKNFCFPEAEYLGKTPKSIFASSDGIADSFSSEEYHAKFYSRIQLSFDEDGKQRGEWEIQAYIPELSEKASGDDVSIAGIVSFDNSVEACKVRRNCAKELAKKYCQAKEWDKITSVLKPFVDRGEVEFIFTKTYYDCKEVQYGIEQGLSIQSLELWKKAFEGVDRSLYDFRFNMYREKLQKCDLVLQTLLGNKIREVAMARVRLIGEDDVCKLFDKVITTDDDIFTFYKLKYEYTLVELRSREEKTFKLKTTAEELICKMDKLYSSLEAQTKRSMEKMREELPSYIAMLHNILSNYWDNLTSLSK